MISFIREPLYICEGIPVYSKTDSYIDNYSQISTDHLDSLQTTGANPFIEDSLWKDLESSTLTLVNSIDIDFLSQSKVLDIGVGTGRLLSSVQAPIKYGVDISQPYLKQVKTLGIQPILSKVEELPFSDSSFDLVLCTDVLEHVLDLHSTISQIYRVIKDGGYLIIRVPYMEDISPYLTDDYPYEYAHLRSFDIPNIKALFTRIFNFTMLSECFSSPYFKPENSRLSLLAEENPIHALLNSPECQDSAHPFNFLLLASLTQNSFVNHAYNLRDTKPEWFKLLEKSVASPLEVSVMFKKN